MKTIKKHIQLKIAFMALMLTSIVGFAQSKADYYKLQTL
ncbi:hypothetical protein SAMN05421766_11163 [Zobellia uliginosa]|uniref:Uncharacterized protein n=1 Tax=Zobellia uliginosa TaxID=143224 RepID=A0ABY1L1R5_9FLAO|nr:hypothetical protein SAMN05421766_11163 [Zobellia uliginosa]